MYEEKEKKKEQKGMSVAPTRRAKTKKNRNEWERKERK
jgi:hypothetical protein